MNMRTWWSRLGIALLLSTICSSAFAARAWLDRDRIEMGETVTLNVQADAGATAPDFSELAANFQVVGQSSQSQLSLVNGQRSSSTLWAVVLAPKNEGVIGIPAFDLGTEKTEPLTLTVAAPPATADAHAGDDVFLEVEATPDNPYVQQQVRFVVRLYYAVTLLEGQLDEPSVKGAEFIRSGNDRNYQKVIEGRRYNVVERRYRLLPERSGELLVPGVRFRGRAVDPSRRGFGFGGGKSISAHAQAVPITVRPQPDGSSQPWLPGESLVLADDRNKLPDQVAVGEPITLDQRLGVMGLAASQLPELTLPEIDGAKVYPDQSNTREEDRDGQVLSTTQRKFAIVATRPGTLIIPEQRLDWWDTEADQAEQAVLPARQIQIVPASDVPPQASTGTTMGADTSAGADEIAPTAASDLANGSGGNTLASSWWPWLAGLFAVLWLLTLWLWRRTTAPRLAATNSMSRDQQPDDSPLLKDALKQGDLAAIDRALRTSVRRRDLPATSLAAVASALSDPAQREAVAALDAARFGSGDADHALALLRDAFTKGMAFDASAKPRKQERELLPPLYPQR